MLPINYELWHQMPDSNKNEALDNINERFALEVSDNYVKKALEKKWRDYKSILKKEYFKKNISLEEKLRNVSPGMLRYQWEDAIRFWNSKKGEELSSGQKVGRLQSFDITHRKKDGSPMTSEAAEIMEKLKDKKAEYKAIALSDSSVNVDDIDNRIITEVLGPKRLRDKMAQMQVSMVELIVQLKAEAASREAEVQRKYEELQQQLKVDAAAREVE
ncbi:Carcinoembryonic antigen-related cell adhesion molecule 2 [Gossypium arboreum]|uniref:Carcinoembryonic antigen-related cell adhesion molecule 2 n=1 Tax=Gossypium arboreum TaxID=29729 RepID=A0A0B0MQR3_GOSAR|nr:Carcinoembryonic antigen-related cell adhesion molecule 2 [Gossypium arboreum]